MYEQKPIVHPFPHSHSDVKKSDLTMEMCSVSRQASNGRTYIAAPVGPVATLTGYVGKQLLKLFQMGFDEQHIDLLLFFISSVRKHACTEV